MGHFSDDINNDDFSNASAEEWSKPSTPAERPTVQPEPADRWGSPIPDNSTSSDPGRWGSEPAQASGAVPVAKKSESNWWIILIIVLVVLCLCACVIIGGPTLFSMSVISSLLFGIQ